jgi:hypothetical protein
MTQFQNSLRFSPYLFQPESEARSWVFSAGEVSTYGLPAQSLSWPDQGQDAVPGALELPADSEPSPDALLQGIDRLIAPPIGESPSPRPAHA